MIIIIQLLTLFLGLLLFVAPIRYKLSILAFSSVCLDSVVVDFIPFGGRLYFLSICFVLSELPHLKKRLSEIQPSIVYGLIIIMIIATLILAIFSPYCHSIKGLVRLFVTELIAKYFVIAYSFLCINKKQDLYPTVRVLCFSLLLLTLFGFCNYIGKYSLWISWLNPSGLDRVADFSISDRFRVQSMFLNPFDYGYICSILLLLFLYSYHIGFISKKSFALLGLMSIWGIIFCGCRTDILVCLIGLSYYFLRLSKSLKIIKFSCLSFIAFSIFFSLNPSIMNGVVDYFSTMFESDVSTGGKGLGGSSIAMRIIQLTTVISYIQGYWLFGRGFDFFGKDLGWAEGNVQALIDEGFWGLEGVYLSLLLERGIVGFLFWGFFYYRLFSYFNRKFVLFKEESAIGGSIIVTYVMFAMMTGELNSVFPTLLFIGILIKLTSLMDKESYNSKFVTK